MSSSRVLVVRLLRVLGSFCLLVWGYVVAMQLTYPESTHWSLAEWLPIRMDYLAEVAFVVAFAAYAAAELWRKA